jgi:hypothetical protein
MKFATEPEMVCGIDLTAASARRDNMRWWDYRSRWAGVAPRGTGLAMRLGGEARKGLRLMLALGQ